MEIKGLIGAVVISVVVFLVLDLLVKVLVKSKTRPSEITALVLIFALGVISAILWVMKNRVLPDPLIVLTVILGSVWLVGFWNMKRWAVIGYTISMVIIQVILLIQNKLTVFSILILIPLAILYYYYPRMS